MQNKKEKIELAKKIWVDILAGLSYRKIAEKHNINASTVNFIANYTLPEMYQLKISNENILKENHNLKIENQQLTEQIIDNNEEIKRLNTQIATKLQNQSQSNNQSNSDSILQSYFRKEKNEI